MKYSDKVIKIGRIKTVIFENDIIVHIPNLNVINFKRNNFETKEQRTEFTEWVKKTFPNDDITYFIPISHKVSKSFLKEWKQRPEVSVTKSLSPNGKNEIFEYEYKS